MGTRCLSVAVLAAWLALLLAGCGGSSKAEVDLAFVSSREGDYAIYVMAADGDGQRRLTAAEGEPGSSPEKVFFQIEPAWSPDGRRIAFASKRAGTLDVFVMNADGTGTRRLTSLPADDSHPTWSPDGKQIAFQRGATGDIYAVDAGGGNARPIVRDRDDETEPAWSADGRWIAYVRRQPTAPVREIWAVHPDGKGAHAVTHLGVATFGPAWSPDGKRIAFSAKIGETDFDIYTIGADGKGLRRVTDTPEDEFEPSWSPDGSEIAFSRDASIVVAALGGGEDRALTESENNDGSPAWSPGA